MQRLVFSKRTDNPEDARRGHCTHAMEVPNLRDPGADLAIAHKEEALGPTVLKMILKRDVWHVSDFYAKIETWGPPDIIECSPRNQKSVQRAVEFDHKYDDALPVPLDELEPWITLAHERTLRPLRAWLVGIVIHPMVSFDLMAVIGEFRVIDSMHPDYNLRSIFTRASLMRGCLERNLSMGINGRILSKL